MKKLSLLIGGLLFSGLIMAQAGDVKGTITLEGQANIGGVVIGQKIAPSLRFRYFATEKLALRLTGGLSNSTKTNENFELANNMGAKGTYTSKSNTWNIALGAEYHVAGTDKVSPYIALDLVYGAGKMIVDGENSTASNYMANYSVDTERPLQRFGVAVMGGLDYNFSSAFYLGGEVGVQISSLTRGSGETEISNNGVVTNSSTGKSKSSTASDLIAAIRLGFRF